MRNDILNLMKSISEIKEDSYFVVYNFILDYCKREKARPSKIKPFIAYSYDMFMGTNNIMLMLDEKNGIQIGTVSRKVKFDACSYYLEGRILERQEQLDF